MCATVQNSPGHTTNLAPASGLFIDWNIVEDGWKQVKGMVTSHWDKLDGIDMSAGDGEEVVGKVQETAEVAKEEIGEQTERVEDQSKK